MSKLLYANLSRLWKNKCFWILMVATLVYALVWMLFGCRQAILEAEVYHYRLDHFYFHFAVPIGGFLAIFGSMFLGTEYSDGTMRNKLVTGARRTTVYFSNYLTVLFAALMMLIVWIIAALIGVPVLGFFRMPPIFLMAYFFIAVGMVASLCAIITFVCMHSTNKSTTVVLSAMLFLGLLVFAFALMYALNQQEMISGITAEAEFIPNPNYVAGVKRDVYEFILDVLPTGQGIQMAFAEIDEPARMVRMMVSSIVIAVVVNLIGMLTYNRKDLK